MNMDNIKRKHESIGPNMGRVVNVDPRIPKDYIFMWMRTREGELFGWLEQNFQIINHPETEGYYRTSDPNEAFDTAMQILLNS